MYYKSINRGLSFTRAGRYTVGLLLGLGFIAISSGYNAVYLSLSIGFSILIISGLLSEKVMNFYRLESLAPVIAEPNTPFNISFVVSNASAQHLYGVENLAFREVPRFRTLSGKVPSLMQATALQLAPSTKDAVNGTCQGLPRGFYRDLVVATRTLYPFGLMAKFKLTRLSTEVAILPFYNESLAMDLRHELRRRVSGKEGEIQFHSHRPYTGRDPVRLIDWKKSAGREPEHWALKTYEALVDDYGILIDASAVALRLAVSAEQYEDSLSRIRTACDVIQEMGRPVALRLENGKPIFGHEDCLRVLVEAPPYARRADAIWERAAQNNGVRLPGTYLRLTLSSNAFSWDETPTPWTP